MDPFAIRPADAMLEVWTGYHIQYDREERYEWQKDLKRELKEVLEGWAILPHTTFFGYYDTTDPTISDTENSLFTNLQKSMPTGITGLRFEHGNASPPSPPVPIDLIGGHLHYYRYALDGQSSRWKADQTLARWSRVPRRLPLDGSARPAWYAMRDANLQGSISLIETVLDPLAQFGIRLIVHASRFGPRSAVACTEELIDGTIAAFHNDRYSDQLFSELAPRFARVAPNELRRALDNPPGPLFMTPAIRTTPSGIQISPDDERCRLGELRIRQDSTGPWSELSGELFSIRPVGSPDCR
jgi:hypothetical protein